jgi:bla regulator protein BlaR1
LIIIDGQKAIKGFSVSEIPSDKIQTIQVLKGSAAIEKYGEEAVNGVLEITTKQ